MKKLPDTNTILRYLLKDNEELYKRAFMFFENVRKGQEKALILEGVLAETIYVLIKYYNVPRREISDKLKEFLLYKGIINEDKKELIHALDIFSLSNLAIVDSILCAKTKGKGYELFTFDEKLNKICS